MCAHPGCKCQGTMEKNGRRYCSDHCANAVGAQGGKCGCGHPGCQ